MLVRKCHGNTGKLRWGKSGGCGANGRGIKQWRRLLTRPSPPVLGARAPSMKLDPVPIRIPRETRSRSCAWRPIHLDEARRVALIVGVVSPGPSFLMVARTAVASSRANGVAAGLAILKQAGIEPEEFLQKK